MARKRTEEQESTGRRSRKEILRERKHQRQTRQIRLVVAGIVGLLVLIFAVAIINEYVIRPGQAVAEVNGTRISLRNWQDRVRYERARMIIGLEDQLEAFQDVGLVQQFSGQQINLLLQPELLGELVLEQMIDEELVRQAAAEEGIVVTEEDVQERIEEQFAFFEGESPTPLPSPTSTTAATSNRHHRYRRR